MSQFVDQMLLQLSDPTQFSQLLAPGNDPGYSRLLTLLKTMYSLEFATIHSIESFQVDRIEFEQLLLAIHQTRGAWRQTTPQHSQTDFASEGSDRLEPVWLDIAAQVQLQLLIEIYASPIESINTNQLDNILIQGQPQPVFDPTDPANIQYYTLNLAIFLQDTLDIAATLHSVKLARSVTERLIAYQKTLDSGEVMIPYAPIVIFPQSVLAAPPFDENTLQTFFAREGILVVFMTPV